MTKHRVVVYGFGLLLTLALASPGLAQSSATQSSATLDAQKMQERAAKVSVEQRTQTDAKLAADAKKVDQSASSSGEATMASRLSKEFGVSADALASQRSQFDAGWGEIMIAHTLQASATGKATADQLLQLRKDGMGWGEIAAGLGLSLGKSVSAVNAESQVALGQTRADGKVAHIQSAAPSAGAAANTNAATQVHTPAADASVHAGVGLGLGHR